MFLSFYDNNFSGPKQSLRPKDNRSNGIDGKTGALWLRETGEMIYIIAFIMGTSNPITLFIRSHE